MPLTESDYLPQVASGLFPGPWLVFAPHPDDETYGMGGSIAVARAAGIEVQVVIVTDGGLGGLSGEDLVQAREAEVNAAVTALGGASLRFWRLPDRGLVPDAATIGLAMALFDGYTSGTAFFPSPTEPHPDHRATAVLVWEALRQHRFPLTPVSYEISVQGACNRLLDITPWIDTKRRAMAVYHSQESQRSYARRVLALNETRSWSLPDEVVFAEGFYVYPPEDAPLWALLGVLHQRDRAGLGFCSDSPGEPPIVAPPGVGPTPDTRATPEPTSAAQSGHDADPDRRAIDNPAGAPHDPAAGQGRLLVVLATNTIGGAEIQTRVRLQALRRCFSITLLTHAHLEPFFDPLTRPDAGQTGVSLVTFESHGLGNPFDYRRGNLLAYARTIAVTARDSRADLIYGVMHNASLFLALARWRFYRTLRNRTLVGSLHGSLVGYFAQRGMAPTLVEQALIRLAVKSCDAVITPSVGLGKELVTRFGGQHGQLVAIHNGLDLAHIRDLADEAPLPAKSRPWILTCCRLADQKDFRTLVGAFARVTTSPLPLLVIVGEGPLAPQIQAWAEERGVADRLLLAGFQTNPYPWIRQADIFALSSHYEGFGNVLVEAMALGVPVVATDCPWGPAEIIEPGRSGALVPPGDEVALGNIFTHWLSDSAERMRLSEGALARANCFTAERMVEAYAALFRRLLAVPPRGQKAAPGRGSDDRVGVLIFHPANVFGGAERTTVNLLTHLPRDQVRVVLVGMAEVFRAPLADAFYDLESHGLNPGGFSTLRRTLVETRRLIAIARRERCQVMLGMLHYGAIVAGLARPASGWRLSTIASPRTPSVAGIRFHVGEKGKRARLWRGMITGFCRLASRLIVAAHGLKDECVREFGAKAKRVRVIPNCVDDTVLALAQQQSPCVREQASPDQPWLILTAGRLVPEKDTGTLLRAFALLRGRIDARLEILGSGPERDTLQDLAISLGIAADVRFLGFSPQPFEEIRRADVFVHTSLFEGFGNTLLEAMASGVPLVATDCDFGPREIVTPGVNGILVPVGDPKHLAKALEALLLDPAKRASLVANALRHVQDFSAVTMARRYEAVFLELGAAARHPSPS